ncbi:MAG: MFS transporter [Desulfotomaculaceae bacterium]|nr:MFS transporter [Desulfotomaculaceae bacterium]
MNFCIVLNYFSLIVIISFYAMDYFHSSTSQAGLASSIFVIGTLVARFFCGRRIERIGRKRMLNTGLILSLVMTLLYFGVNSMVSLFVLRFVHGAAFGICGTATGTIVANIIPVERRGEGIGYYSLSVTLAAALGPFTSMFIAQHGSMNMIFMASAIPVALSLVSALFLSAPEIELTEEQLQEMKEFKFNSFFEPKAIPISIFGAVIYFCYSSILTFLTAYSKEINLVDAASLFFVIFSVVVFVSRPFTGRWFDFKGENLTMYPAILIFATGMLVFSQAHQGSVLLLAAAIIGLGFGTIQSSSQAISIKVTPAHRMGLANSTFFMSVDAGIGIGPFILGMLIPYTGYRGMYTVTAMVVLACTLLYYLLHG